MPSRPAVTIRVVPSRGTSFVLDPAPIIIPTAIGTIAAPTSSAE
jgi:hypothetical protein